MIPTILQFDFMVRAFAVGIIIAIITSLIGNFLVVRRYSLIADTLSHIALSGVAIGILLHAQPVVTTIIVTTIAAILIEKLRKQHRIPADAILAMFLPGGLALSVVIMSFTKGYVMAMNNYLFGSITTVTDIDVLVTCIFGLITVAVITYNYRALLYTSFDEESAQVRGVPVNRINTLLMVLTAVVVSLAMRIVGILLVGALMIIPVVTAMQIGKSMRQSLLLSLIFSVISVVVGLIFAFYANLPAGGIIVLTAFSFYFFVSMVKVLRKNYAI